MIQHDPVKPTIHDDPTVTTGTKVIIPSWKTNGQVEQIWLKPIGTIIPSGHLTKLWKMANLGWITYELYYIEWWWCSIAMFYTSPEIWSKKNTWHHRATDSARPKQNTSREDRSGWTEHGVWPCPPTCLGPVRIHFPRQSFGGSRPHLVCGWWKASNAWSGAGLALKNAATNQLQRVTRETM